MLEVSKITPAPQLVEASSLPRRKKSLLGGGPRVLSVRWDEVALVPGGDGVELHAPAGSRPIEIELDEDALAFVMKRDFEAELALDDIQFADDVPGSATLIARLHVLGKEPHPLANEIKARVLRVAKAAPRDGVRRGPRKVGVIEAFGRCIEKAMAGTLGEAMRRVEYRPGVAVALAAEALDGLHKDPRVTESCDRHAGLALDGAFVIKSVCAPSVDANAEAQRQAREDMEKQTRDAVAQLARIARDSTVQDAADRAEELKVARAGEKELIAIQKETRARELRAKAVKQEAEAEREEHEAHLKEAEVELKKKEAELKAAEAEGKRQETERLRTEAEMMCEDVSALRRMQDRYDRDIASNAEMLGQLRDSLEVLGQRIEDFGKQQSVGIADPLGVVAVWRAHNAEGVIVPQMGPVEKLPSGTMLDVMVTTTRDAWVYVLLRGSMGVWQNLVPDTDRLMGITRKNRQSALEPVIWPGVNKTHPGYPPCWALDLDPGYERVMVVASLGKLDIDALLAGDGVKNLRERASPALARGFCNPASSPAGGAAQRQCAYGRVVTALIGDGIVMQENVIVHTRA